MDQFVFVIGLLCGVVMTLIFYKDWRAYRVGSIKVKIGAEDDSDRYLFQFDVEPEEIPKHAKVSFDVDITP